MKLLVAVACGGALGAVARYGAARLALQLFGAGFPVATLFVNIAGSFAMGVIVHWAASRGDGGLMRAFWAVGVLGAFTTFSTFSLDAVTLYKERSLAVAASYVGLSVTLSIAALVAGVMTARMSG
ncbi:MAG: CrcB family protein [Pseudomonadota bacterium]